jgi:N-acetylmuramoyl-L-alanine amidase
VRHRFVAAALAVAAVLQLAAVVSYRVARPASRPAITASDAPTPLASGSWQADIVSGDELVSVHDAPEGVQAALSPRGVLVPVIGRENGTWKVSTPCGREAFLAHATPIRRASVVIDPGHGGYDPGATGPNGLTESRLNLAVSQHAKAALERAGYSVVLTRSAEHGMSLSNRRNIAVALQPQAFVSVHHNAAATVRSDTPGSEMYHQVGSAESKRLAGLIYEEIVAALSAYSVQWVTSGAGVTWRTRANGEDWYAMVRLPPTVPAALAELAFLSNRAEADLLADPEVQRVEGEAVARGIVRFLMSADPGSGFVPGGQMPPRPRTGRGGDDVCDDPPL